MFQKVIFLFLILGLGFFLYLLKTGEINQEKFNIKNFQKPVHFEIQKNTTKDDLGNEMSDIKLLVSGVAYQIYSFSKTEFKKISSAEYPSKKYLIPSYAKDAVTGNWLGTRYTFYVVEEKTEMSTVYRVYRSVQTTDSVDDPTYTVVKEIILEKKKNTGSDTPLY